MLDYMATRPGVIFEDKTESWMNKEATEKQKNLIAETLELNPELKELLEYEDYKLNPTIANASELLDAAKESMMNSEFEASTLVQYMAERPGVVKKAGHGLFSFDGTADLEAAKKTVENHPGQIWTNIVSLRREDAHRLGYETQEAWKDAVCCVLPDIQRAMKISPEQFRWYAAFHNTGRHPHIHLMIFSADGKSGFLNKEGIRNIKQAFSTHIFAEERSHIYSMKDEYRQKMKDYTEQKVEKLIREIDANPTPDNAPELEKKMKRLSDALKDYKGKAVYQYLPKNLKAMADDVMIEFSKEKRVHEIYSSWCSLENELQEMYKNNPDDPELLVNNKAFLPIKNEIIRQAHWLAKQAVFKEKAATLAGIPEERIPWLSEEQTDSLLRKAFEAEHPEFSEYLDKAEHGDIEAQYRIGRLYFYGFEDIKKDYREGKRWLKKAADSGHPLAVFELGKMKLQSKKTMERWDGLEQLLLAFRFLKTQAENGNFHAEKAMAEYYQKGLIFEADPDMAGDWLKRAEEHQSMKQSMYSKFASHYWLDEDEELEQWFNRTEQAMEQSRKDKAEACEWYRNGKEDLKTGNIEKAKEYFRQAADKDHTFAQYQMGKLCAEEGEACQDEAQRESLMEESRLYYAKALDGFLKAEAENGDVLYQSIIARMYYNGLGTEQDYEKAFIYYLKAAEQNDPDAQYRVGRMFLAGEGTEQNTPKAIEWLEKAANQNNPFAQYALGKIYFDGEYVPEDLKQAYSWLKKASDNYHCFADYILGKMYDEGRGVPKNSNTADTYYNSALKSFIKKEAKSKDLMLQNLIARMYYNGLGTEQNYEKAFVYYLKAAEQNDPDAQYRVGRMFFAGEGTEQNTSKAIEWLEKAAVQEDSGAAAYLLGKIYSSDEEPDFLDKVKAKEYFRLAADNDHLFAQYQMGRICAEEMEACQDEAQRESLAEESRLYYAIALDGFLKAEAENGDVLYQSIIARMYYNGLGTEQDYEKAFIYYLKAAEQNDPDAQYRVGQMFFAGEGTEQNTSKAVEWLEKAAVQEDSGAAAYLLGKIYSSDEEPDFLDKVKAKEYFRLAADNDHLFAQYQMGRICAEEMEACQDEAQRESLAEESRLYYAIALDGFLKAEAENGDVLYQSIIARMYYNGLGTEQDYEKAFIYYLKAAEQNDPDAQYRVGQMFFAGEGTEQNTSKAVEWLEKAAVQEDSGAAAYLLGKIYSSDEEPDFLDKVKAKEYFRLAADNDHLFAQYQMGRICAEEMEACQDEAQRESLAEESRLYYAIALDGFLKAEAENGDVLYQSIIARMYYNGLGTEQDYEKAFIYYLKAAEQNDPDAQYRVGQMFFAGEGTEQNTSKAVEWLEKAAVQEDSGAAAYLLGKIYSSDEEPDFLDKVKAREYFRQAADKEHTFAQYQMGRICAEEIEACQDEIQRENLMEESRLYYAKALDGFLKAEAENGDVLYQSIIARMYYNGLGTEQNYEKAFVYYLKAAEQNDPDAQYRVGQMFFAGEGTEQNTSKAVEWLEKAAVQEDSGAAAYLLGKIYSSDEEPDFLDKVKAREYFRQAADKEHTFAQYQMGRICAEETEACQDEAQRENLMEESRLYYAKALDGFLKAEAENGDVLYQSIIARMYYNGLGTEQNYEKAFVYYLKAAEQNDPDAQYRIGRMFFAGEGTARNIPKAIEWLEKAALTEKKYAPYTLGKCYLEIARSLYGTEYQNYCRMAMECFTAAGNAGNAYAVYQLGNMYLYGRGTARDFEKAGLLYRQAETMGCEAAREKLAQLDRSIQPSVGIAGAIAAVIRMMSQNMQPSHVRQQGNSRRQQIKEALKKETQGIKME